MASSGKVWLLDQERGDSECETPYVITGICRFPGSPTADESSSQSTPKPPCDIESSNQDLSLSLSAPSAEHRVSNDLQTFTTPAPTESLPAFLYGPMNIQNTLQTSNVDILPLPPTRFPDTACTSIAWHQGSPLPEPDPSRIYLQSVLEAYRLRPRQPTADVISSREPLSVKRARSPLGPNTAKTESFVFMIAPESFDFTSEQYQEGAFSSRESPTESQTRIEFKGYITSSATPSQPSTPFSGYPAAQLKPIRYRPGHILRVSCHWDERVVTRVYVIKGQTFYDLVGVIEPPPRPTHQTHDSPNNDEDPAKRGKSNESAIGLTRSGSQTPLEPLTMTMPSLEAHASELLSAHPIQAQYLCYPEGKLRRFSGDTTTLGEFGEIGKMGRSAGGRAEEAGDKGGKAGAED
ncbi:MAG: hypothetical protein Q9160_005114 [Pyrenula sp. 1 TL-2023]